MRMLCYGDSNTYGYDPRGFFGDRCWRGGAVRGGYAAEYLLVRGSRTQ